MAKGKSTSGKNYVSKGIHSNESPARSKELRAEFTGSIEQLIAKREAWAKGRRVMLLVPNTDQNTARKAPFVKVPATEVWGSHKNTSRAQVANRKVTKATV